MKCCKTNVTKMTTNEFKDWAFTVYEEFYQEYQKPNCRYEWFSNENINIIYDKRTGKVGISRCHKDDTPSTPIGITIAYFHLRGWKLPKITDTAKLSQMVKDDKFYVINGNTAETWTFISKYDNGYIAYNKAYDKISTFSLNDSKDYVMIK